MKTIVCPVDFEKASLNCIEFSAHVAKNFGFSLKLIHIEVEEILDSLLSGSGLPNENEHKRSESHHKLENIKQLTEEKFDIEVTYQVILTDKDIQETFEHHFEKNTYDLLICGTNGMDSWYQQVFGSNAWNFAQAIDAPTWIIPENATYQSFNNVNIAIGSFDEHDISAMVDAVTDFHGLFNLPMDFVHIADLSSESMVQNIKTLRESLHQEKGITTDLKYMEEENVVAGLLRLSNEPEALCCMIHLGRSLVEDLLHKSVSKEVTSYSENPVMLLA